MKKFIATLLFVAAIVSSFSLTVSADTGTFGFTGYDTPMTYASGSSNSRISEQTIESYVYIEDFKTLFLENIAQCNENIDISEYNLGYNSTNTDAIKDYIWHRLPEAFNVYGIGFSYSWSGLITSVRFTYRSFSDIAEEYEKCYNKMLDGANKLLEGIEGNTNLDDVQKALLLHDRLALWNEYDTVGLNAGAQYIYTAYGALGERGSVCQGYAMAYMYLLNRVGIENYYCSSETLNHGWNIVYINGKPYHVDVTWDDPTPDRLGRVEHDNFLRSSNGIYATGHKATDYDTSPSDTKYDNYFWQNSKAEFQLVDNEIYYINNDAASIKRYSDNATICGVEAIWSAGYNSYWNGNFSCLSSDGKSLFYSQPKAIYRLDLTTNKSEAIYTPNTSEYESIFGFTYQDETIICDISDSPNYIVQQITKPYKHNYEVQIIYGDANGDGKVNGRDYGMLMQYLNGWAVEIDLTAADVTGDGKVNGRDYGLIMQYLNGWDVTISPKS